jgi:hypothetical protein
MEMRGILILSKILRFAGLEIEDEVVFCREEG